MNDYEALDYAYQLRDHLYTMNFIGDVESNLKIELESLSVIEEAIHDLNRKLDDLRQLATALEKEYQIYNFRYGLGELNSDFEHTKSMRKEAWAKIYQAGEDRERLLRELRLQHKLRDKISNEVIDLQRKFKSTRDFMRQKENVVSLYSIVTVNLSGDQLTFVLVTESQRNRVSLGDLHVYSIDSPLGSACLGKRSNEKFSYVAPSGRTLEGDVINCDFPTAQQLDNLITILEARPLSKQPARINPFELFDRHGSNNSRNRKGG